LKKINKRGAKIVENQPSPNLLFKTQDDHKNIIKKSSCLVLGWKEALFGAWWPMMWKLSAKI
jgi:hypothetical protein